MRFMIIALIVMLMGCGSDDSPEEVTPVADFKGATGTLADMKMPDRVAMAPTAPGTGIPFVKEVGYYHDWKRTKPLKGTVSPGKTIHVIDPQLKHGGFCKSYAEAFVDFRIGWLDSTEMPTILLNKTIGLTTPKPKEAIPSLRMFSAAFASRSRSV